MEVNEQRWQEFHDRHNDNCWKHLLAHSILLSIAICNRDKGKILRQGWLSAAVLPVHVRDAIRSWQRNSS